MPLTVAAPTVSATPFKKSRRVILAPIPSAWSRSLLPSDDANLSDTKPSRGSVSPWLRRYSPLTLRPPRSRLLSRMLAVSSLDCTMVSSTSLQNEVLGSIAATPI
jgi:hypothetical protein